MQVSFSAAGVARKGVFALAQNSDSLRAADFLLLLQLLAQASPNSQLLSRRGCRSPASAGGFGTHRDSMTSRCWSQIVPVAPLLHEMHPTVVSGELRDHLILVKP
eukprot:SAG25_NODE_6885_length_521_cov_0.917062_1_plen_105_part_00